MDHRDPHFVASEKIYRYKFLRDKLNDIFSDNKLFFYDEKRQREFPTHE